MEELKTKELEGVNNGNVQATSRYSQATSCRHYWQPRLKIEAAADDIWRYWHLHSVTFFIFYNVLFNLPFQNSIERQTI